MRSLLFLPLFFNVCLPTIYYVKVAGNLTFGTDTVKAWSYNTFKTATLATGDMVI
jgi:hypothetical protein